MIACISQCERPAKGIRGHPARRFDGVGFDDARFTRRHVTLGPVHQSNDFANAAATGQSVSGLDYRSDIHAGRIGHHGLIDDLGRIEITV